MKELREPNPQLPIAHSPERVLVDRILAAVAEVPFVKETFNNPASGFQPTIDTLTMAATYADTNNHTQENPNSELDAKKGVLSFFVDNDDDEHEIEEMVEYKDHNQVWYVLRKFRRGSSSPVHTQRLRRRQGPTGPSRQAPCNIRSPNHWARDHYRFFDQGRPSLGSDSRSANFSRSSFFIHTPYECVTVAL